MFIRDTIYGANLVLSALQEKLVVKGIMDNTTIINNTTLNSTKRSSRGGYSLVKNSRVTFAVFESALTPFIVVINLVVIVAIFTNPTLRQNFRYLVIVSIAVADIIIGLVSCPVRADYILKESFSHGCSTYIFISVFETFVQMFVGSWSMVCINMDYLLTIFRVKLPQLSPLKRKVVIALLIALPWMTMCFVILPVAYHYAGRMFLSPKFCRVIVSKSARSAIIYLSYMVPAALTITQVVVMTTAYIFRRRTVPSSMILGSDLPSPWMLITASLVTVLFVFVEQTFFLLGHRILLKFSLMDLVTIYYTIVSLSDAKSFVLPIVWFMCPNIRSSCLDLYNKLPWRRTIDVYRSDLTVDYKNLAEEGHL